MDPHKMWAVAVAIR